MAYQSPPVFPETLQEDSDVLTGPGSSLQPGDHVGRFEVVQWLGEGGSASVYKIRHRQLESHYALKVLHGIGSQSAMERLMQEGKLQSNLQHPHIVRVHDVLDYQGAPALVMDYVRGRTLAMALEEGDLDLPTLEDLFRQILSAVGAAHKAGVVHRDLKPSNVILTTHEGRPFAQVTDFGVARAGGLELSEKTRTGALLGTLEYMSPEQIRGEEKIDHRSDLFSLGVMLYEMCLGVRPFAHKHLVQLIGAIDRADYIAIEDLNPSLPAHLQDAIRTTLVADPNCRVPDSKTLVAILDGTPWHPLITQEPKTLASLPETTSKPLFWRVSPLLSLGLALALLLLAIGFGDREWRLRTTSKEAEYHRELAQTQLEKSALESLGWRQKTVQPGEALASFRAAHALALELGETPVLSSSLLAELTHLGGAVRQFPFDDQVSQVAFSPDGSLQALGTLGGHVEIRHTDTGEMLSSFSSQVRERLLGLRFSPDGRFLAILPSASDEAPGRSDPARLFDVASGRLVYSLSHGARTAQLVFNYESTIAATLGYDHRVILWDLSTGAPLYTLSLDEENPIACLAFSPRENLLVAAQTSLAAQPSWHMLRPGPGRSWESTTLEIPRKYIGQGECQLLFQPHGESFLSALGNGLILVDAETGAIRHSLRTSTWRILAQDKQGSRIVHGTVHGGAILRRLPDLTEIKTLKAREGTITRVHFQERSQESQESAVITAGTDGIVQLFSSTDGEPLGGLAGNRSWVLGLDSTSTTLGEVISAAGRDGILRTWRFIPSLPSVRRLPEKDLLTRSDGLDVTHYYWCAETNHLYLATRDEDLLRWELQENRSENRALTGSVSSILSIPDGTVALSLHSGEFLIFSADGEEVRRRVLQRALLVGFSPDDHRLVARRSHSLLFEKREHPEEIQEVRFQDRIRLTALDWKGERALVIDDRDKLTIIDLLGEKPRQTLPLHHNEGANLAISPDSSLVAIGFWSGGAELWDLNRGEHRANLEGHGDSVTSLLFTPDGTLVVTGSQDQGLRVFSTASGELAFSLPGHRRPPVALDIDETGEFLLSVGQDRQLCLWSLSSQKAKVCVALEVLPRRVRFTFYGEEPLVEVLDESYQLWTWRLADLLAVPDELLLYSGSLTNLRVCRETKKILPILPFPAEDSVWAPEELCE